MSKVKIDEYRRKFYDVKVELDITSFVIKRIYVDELDQYRQNMNTAMLKAYGCDENYTHKDEFNEENKMLAEDLAMEEVQEDEWTENAEVQEQNVLHEPETGEETTEGNDIWRCVICSEYFTGYGNNPDPVKNYGDCCDSCNTNKIIPLRVKQIINEQRI
jgi:rubrerythrin